MNTRETLRLLCAEYAELDPILRRSALTEDQLVAQIYHESGKLVLEMLNEHVKSE